MDEAERLLAAERCRVAELEAIEARFDGFQLRVRTLERENEQLAAAAAAAASAAAAAAALERAAAAGGSQVRLIVGNDEEQPSPARRGRVPDGLANSGSGVGSAPEACVALARLAGESMAGAASVLEEMAAAIAASSDWPTSAPSAALSHPSAVAGVATAPKPGAARDERKSGTADGADGAGMARLLVSWTRARLRAFVESTADGRGVGSLPPPNNMEGDLDDGHVLLHLVQAGIAGYQPFC